MSDPDVRRNGTRQRKGNSHREEDFLREVPRDEEAERALLGAMLASYEMAAEAVEIVEAEDFFWPTHQTVFAAMRQIYSNTDREIDRVLVRRELLKNGELERVGGIDFLHELMEEVPLIGNAPEYARMVRDASVLRRVLDAGSRIQDIAVSPDATPRATLAGAQALLEQAGAGFVEDDEDGERVLLGEIIDKGVPSPDEFEPEVLVRGAVHSFYAESEVGKTWLMLWLIVRAIDRGEKVLYYDDENGEDIIGGRLADLGVDSSKVDRLLYYVPDPELTLSAEDTARYRRKLERFGPDLVIFDSLSNYLGSSGLDESLSGDIEKWSAAYTRVARNKLRATVAILDHPGHDADRPRGSSRKKQEVDAMWRLAKTQPYSPTEVGEITLLRKKDRRSWLPSTVKFSVGGSPNGFVFERSSGTIEERKVAEQLLRTERAVVDALRDFGRDGARATEWQRVAAAEPYSVTRPTFYRAKPALVKRGHVVEEDGVFRVVEPPDDPPGRGLTGPPDEDAPGDTGGTWTSGRGITTPDPDDTFDNRVQTPETDDGLTRSNAGITGDVRPPDPEVSQVSPPFRGETVRPGPETGETDAGEGGVIDLAERARRLLDQRRRSRGREGDTR